MLPKNLVSLSASSSKISLLKLASAAALFCGLAAASPLQGQSAEAAHTAPVVASRLTSPIVESSRVTLQGAVHPLANRANDRGALPDGTKLERMQIILKRSDEQESSLKRLIGDLHSASSPNYHKWLTPEQFGKQFGPSDEDVAKLESWLQTQGFTVTQLRPGRQVLEITGTAGQLKNIFHAEMHQYSINGVMRYANANAPDVPAALTPVFGGFVSLNNFRFKNYTRVLGKAQLNSTTHESKPDWTIGSSSNYNLVLAPSDFAVQYDLNPVYAAGTKGDGQTIAIVNESNINVALVNSYRTLFGLPANPPQVIIDGSDPGVDGINSPLGPNGASGEAYLDVELAGAVAPNAQIDLVIANDTAVDYGLTLAMEHAVYGNIAPVVSLSFGSCEANQGSFNTFISSLWEQAAAQGQTVLVSTGDSGSAGCDRDTDFAVGGAAVNGLGSTPYNVAVGGTDFYYSGGSSTVGNYWNLTPTNSTPTVSLTTPAPEQPWNDSQYGLNLYSIYATDGTTSIAAGSGGPSTLGFATTTNGNTTYGPYPKPSWQTGFGDSVRDLPDLSLFAANGLNNSYYPICAGDADCQPVSSSQLVQITGIGGTSASTPAFAGIMALINQKYGRQGQANYTLYPLATQFPSSFHDVTAGTIAVPCNTTTVYTRDSNGNITGSYPPKQCKSVSSPLSVTDNTYGQTTEGEISVDGTTAAYNAGTGYDLATGLGTIDANNLITNWNKISLAATTTTLTPSATSFTHGTNIMITGQVSGTPTPTGDVALVTTSTSPSNQGEKVFTLDSTGAYTGSISYLPGGSYNIYGYYSGDSASGPSSSTPVAITVSPENSATALNLYSGSSTVPSGGTVQYGAATFLDAVPGSTDSTKTTTAPTGSVVFTDGSTTLNTAVVTANGYAEYSQPFSVGSHSVKAAYSGDSSYGASTSAAATFTVAKNSPDIFVTYTNQDQNNNPVNGQVTYLAVQVENSASANGLALAPTGTISVTGAPSGTNATATLVAGVDPYNHAPQGTAYFAVPATASGNYTLTFSYAGDANYSAVSTNPATYTFDLGGGTSATTTTATASASTTTPTSLVSVTATVTSTGSTRPTGKVYLVASEYVIASGTLPTGSGNSASLTFNFDSASLFEGTNQITVQYIPSSSSFGSSATVVTIANPLSDFAMVPVSTLVSVPGSGTGAGYQNDVINLTSTNGFAGAVSLSCSASGGVLCSFGSTSATLTSGGSTSATLLIDTGSVTGPGSYNVVVTGKNAAGTVVHTLSLTAITTQTGPIPRFTLAGTAVTIASQGATGTSTITVTPTNGFTGTVALTCAVTSAPSGALTTDNPTCSAASANVTGTSAVTATLTINTTAQTAKLDLPAIKGSSKGIFTAGGGLALAAMAFFGVPFTRRRRKQIKSLRALRMLSLAFLFALAAGAAIGCGGGGSSAPPPSGGTTTGSYTLTVTGTSGSTTANTTITVTVN